MATVDLSPRDVAFPEALNPSSELTKVKDVAGLKDDDRETILDWLSPMDVSAKHHDVSSLRHPGTGDWLIKSDQFKAWQHGTGQTLWCLGIPGVGKTVLASRIIDHLCNLRRNKPVRAFGVAWIYYHYKEQATQTPDALRLSLIRQLVLHNSALYTNLKSEYAKSTDSHPMPGQLISDIGVLVLPYSQVYIVVDALDECAADADVLNILGDLQRSGANIIITLRDNMEKITHSDFVHGPSILIRGNTDDITRYVNARMLEQTRLAGILRPYPALRQEIVEAILNVCEGR